MNKFWTKTEIEALSKVSTLEELADIAVAVLGRMSATGQEIVELCGPISTGGLGNTQDNMARFQLAIERARENGLLVFDLVPFQAEIDRVCSREEGQSTYNWEILEIFFRRIFESGYIHRALFLPGWEGSTGARWEREFATKLGLIVEEHPEHWLVATPEDIFE